MTALDKLRAIDKAASWGQEGFPPLRAAVARNDLYALSKLLLPVFEALDECGRCCGPDEHGVGKVMAQLEEALKD